MFGCLAEGSGDFCIDGRRTSTNMARLSHALAIGRRIAMKRFRPVRLLALLVVVLLVAIVGAIAVPALILRDEPVSARVAPYLADARASLFREAVRILPLHLRFVAARCRADGGTVLVFEQWEPPYVGVRYGYIMSGAWPPTGWGGGTGSEDLADDSEIAAFLGSNEVSCE